MELRITSHYTEDTTYDIVERFEPFFRQGTMYVRPDNKVGIRARQDYMTPWIHVRLNPERVCPFYWSLFYPSYNTIHSRCHSCWKVVARPNTLLQLVACHEIQKKMDTESKCGIETRDSVPANYGCYWYNDSLREGLKKKDWVIGELERAEMTDIPVFLKRGCTEFEVRYPDSSKWQIKEGQMDIEKMLSDTLVFETNLDIGDSPWFVKLNTQRWWVKFAASRGDKTYEIFNGGKPLVRDYRKYTWEDEEGEKGYYFSLDPCIDTRNYDPHNYELCQQKPILTIPR